jgi:MFS family permease
MCIAMLGIVAGHVLIGSAHSGWQIILLYMLFLPIPIVFSTGIPAQILVTRWFVKKRGVALALSAFGVALAGVIFPPIVVVLLRYWSWRVTWYVFAAAILLLVTTTLFFVVRDRQERDGRDWYCRHPASLPNSARPTLPVPMVCCVHWVRSVHYRHPSLR